jgi:thiol-disulfide isomerase/thioredoxin
MPSLDGANEWWNAQGQPEIQPGKVTLIHFWAVSCHICHETMNDIVGMAKRYESDGLQVVALHMPRYETDTDVEKVRQDVQDYQMFQPIGLDHGHAITNRFENEYVPAFFVFDREGQLKFRAAGDRGLQKVEPKIREALGLPPLE